jgi:glycosyltransferase involved in cell wall biosynthesis
VVPGGVDRSGEYRVIPAVLALIERLASQVNLRVFALRQEREPARWQWQGVTIENIGSRRGTVWRGIAALRRAHRERPLDVIHSLWAGEVGFVATCAARTLGVPTHVHVAGGELAAIRDIGYGGALKPWGRARERFVLRGATSVSAASDFLLRQIAGFGVVAERVPLGPDAASWPARAPRARAAGEPARLIQVASLNRVKDQPTLLRAFREVLVVHGDATLDIVGEDTLGGAVQALARELGLGERVRFHGFHTQAALRPLVESAHVHVVSSRHEAGPLALLEAATVGVPTVGTAVGHVADWAPDAAVAVPPGDASALARAMLRLLDDDAARLGLAHEAQRRALAANADLTAQRFLSIYSGLLKARS